MHGVVFVVYPGFELSPAARFAQAFERHFGVAPRLFRDMHAEM